MNMLNKDRYTITEWYGVPQKYIVDEKGELAEFRIREMAEAGFTLISIAYTPELNKKVLAICEKYGLECTVEDARIRRALKLEDGWEELVASAVNDYKDYPALYNYHVVDEPNSSAFPALRKISDKLLELDPAHEPYINLFPNYASQKQLGNETYREHVEKFIREVKPTLVSYDHYHFCRNEEGTEIDRYGFFDNIEEIRRASLANGLPYLVIVLLCEHGCYRYLTEAEIRWEAFQSLAYGANAVSYFTYWTPSGDNDEFWKWREAMISVDGVKCRHYDDVRRVNEKLQRLGTQLLGAKSEAVFHYGKCAENVTYFNGYGKLDSVKVLPVDSDECAGLTLGFFDNGKILIANKDYKNAVTVELGTSAKVKCFLADITDHAWGTSEDKTLPLLPGDAMLIELV